MKKKIRKLTFELTPRIFEAAIKDLEEAIQSAEEKQLADLARHLVTRKKKVIRRWNLKNKDQQNT